MVLKNSIASLLQLESLRFSLVEMHIALKSKDNFQISSLVSLIASVFTLLCSAVVLIIYGSAYLNFLAGEFASLLRVSLTGNEC